MDPYLVLEVGRLLVEALVRAAGEWGGLYASVERREREGGG